MPYINTFNINENHLTEVLRVKANITNPVISKTPYGLKKTINPNNKLSVTECFDHIRNVLRVKDIFGKLIIK